MPHLDGSVQASVIDLGDLSEEPPPPHGRVHFPVMDVRWRRLSQLVAVLVVLLVAGGAAVSPPRPRLALVASVPVGLDGRMMVSGSRLVVIDRVTGHYEISAFTLPGGNLLWHSPMDGSGAGTTILTTPTTVIAMMAGETEGSFAQAFNLRTGALLWQQSSISAILHEGDNLFVFGTPSESGASTLHVIDAPTGHALWTASIPPDCQTRLVNDGNTAASPGLIELCVDARQLIVLDAATGKVRARTDVNLFPIERGPDSADLTLASPGIDAIDNLVIVLHDNYPTATLDAFNARDLTPVWSNVPATPQSFLYACAPDICMIGGGVQAVLDPITGKWLPGLRPPGVTKNLGSASSVASGGQPTTLVIVPAGEPGAKVGTGIVPTYAYAVAAGQTVSVPQAHDGLTWVARQVTTTKGSEVEPLQLFHGTRADACVPITSYVACATTKGTLNVWRVP